MIEAVSFLLALFPLAGFWATYKLYRWNKFYRSRFLGGLLIASIAAQAASVVVAVVAIMRLMTPVDVPLPPIAGRTLGPAIIVLEGVFVFLVWRWRDLDKNIEVEGETRNQREDRQFGEQRRDLEDQHNRERG